MKSMEEGRTVNESEYTQDGTVDLKGKPVPRSNRGGWKACSFLLVYEVFERMSYYGISSNLVLYLRKKLHQGIVTSSNNVSNWVGTIWITPILGAYIADAHLGRYWTFVVASIIYLLVKANPVITRRNYTNISGMCLLTLSVSFPSLKPPECHEMDVTKCKKASTMQLLVFYGALYILAIGTGGTKPNISTIGADQFDDFDPKEKAHKLSFFNGHTLLYRHKVVLGSPYTRMAKVIVAALRKWKVTVPIDSRELYELDFEEYTNKGKFRINSTPTMRFLNKACVETGSSTSEWMLCSVTQVEETKQILRLIPIWIMQRFTRNPRGITLLQRLGIGIIMHFVIMMVASVTERYRLRVAKEHGVVENGGQVPLSIFILLPQFILTGIGEAFFEVATIEFFYDQAPESMKSLRTSYSLTTAGIGSFISTFLLSIISKVTEQYGHKGWILNNLNASHLDYCYAFLAALNFLNFMLFMIVTKYFEYRAEISDSIDLLGEELKEKKTNV
ncbi:hypothetical protein VNO77_14208 [Canavalia gladiata]|uniref:Uncharacterized protein n=1 Tax=Canavalia gladiata TaxID=3824 RepID=A0AAN9LY00_CANGL